MEVTEEVVGAARDALSALVRLESCEGYEPGPHLDLAWRSWRHGSYVPAYQAWTRAMDHLECLVNNLAMDLDVDRNGRTWVITCVRILSGEIR